MSQRLYKNCSIVCVQEQLNRVVTCSSTLTLVGLKRHSLVVSSLGEFGCQKLLWRYFPYKHLYELDINLHEIQLAWTSPHNSALLHYSHFQGIWFVLDVFTTSDMENKNNRAWPSSSIIFPFLCSEHQPYNGLAQRKTHFLPEAAKILIKTQRSVQQLPRCMSSNGNTWGKRRGRSAACNSLTEGEERRRSRGDRGFHKGQREREREYEREREMGRKRGGAKTWGVWRIGEETALRQGASERSGTRRIKEVSLPLTLPFLCTYKCWR